MADTILKFRDQIAKFSPRWLQNRIAGKLLYTFGLHVDVLAAAVVEGIRKRFVGLPEAADALSLSGRERRIRRGRNESDVSYAARLQPWLDDHRTRGNPYTLLNQFGAFLDETAPRAFLTDGSGNHILDDLGNPLLGDPPTITLQYETGKAYDRHAADNITTRFVGPYDSDVAHWARWWLIVQWQSTISDDGFWGDPGTWSDGGLWDLNLASEVVEDLKTVPAEWNAAHCLGNVTLLGPGAELWDTPAGLWSDPGVWDGGKTVSFPVDP